LAQGTPKMTLDMTNGDPATGLGMLEWGTLAMALAGGCVGLVVLILAQRSASAERRRRFAQRYPMIEDEWFQRYHPLAVEERPIVLPVLQELAREVGVHWTQLRPEDTFSVSFRLRRWRFLSADEDALNYFSDWLACWAKRNKVSIESLTPLEDELGRFLDRLRAAYQRDHKEP